MGVRFAKKMIRVSKSTISNKEISAVSKVLKKEHLGMGEEVNNFESFIYYTNCFKAISKAVALIFFLSELMACAF